ncbi:MAG TPA: spore germination protein [Clostridiales bacterium]|nr:MAG: spore gernimation protein KA [Clostridiales bacterium GWD2_32_19]HCC06632.1 spore germination protein [Clostridiales bacterium]
MFGLFNKRDPIKETEKDDKPPSINKLTGILEEDIKLFSNIFSNNDTLIIRKFQNKYLDSAKCCVIYIEGMVKNEILNENIIKPILSNNLGEEISNKNLLEELQYKVIVSNNVKKSSDIDEIVNSVIYGDTIFLLDGYDKVLIINSKGWETRAVAEPTSEKVIRGPREGFTESININLSLLRRKIKNPDLKFKFKEIGVMTHTKTCICYIEGLVSDKILKELNKRLDDIKIDGILDAGYIQELIKDSPYSPFETVGTTERPDVLAAKLLEGRIGLFIDGTPFVLTVPFLMIEYFQVNEDYYNNFIYASINRILRITGGLLSISVPAIYISLITYNQEMIPTPLILSISAARQGVPFPTVVEALLMLLVFEILREAGTRMPVQIGQAVNIVGALVLGQAAVEAKLVSAPIVIVTALTGISSLLIVNLIGASIITRTIFLLLASIMGMYGYIFGVVGLVIYLMSMRSFGVPYMLNIISFDEEDIKDTIIRAPWWEMNFRTKLIVDKNYVRQPKKSRGK